MKYRIYADGDAICEDSFSEKDNSLPYCDNYFEVDIPDVMVNAVGGSLEPIELVRVKTLPTVAMLPNLKGTVTQLEVGHLYPALRAGQHYIVYAPKPDSIPARCVEVVLRLFIENRPARILP